MSDKVRLIYNKIENRIDEICDDGFVLKENQQEYETLTDLEDFIDSLPEEPVNEDLEEEIEIYSNNIHFPICYDDYKRFAHHFAEWQKQKDQETIELAEDHAMLAGMMKEREEMMKNAVDATVLDVDAQTIEFGLWPEKLLDIKEGDKVKIIIVKEEQQ